MNRDELERMVAAGMSISDISKEVNKCKTSICYWLKKYDLKTSYKTSGRHKSWTDEDMIGAISTSVSIAEVLRKIGLSSSYGNYQTVHNFISMNGIDTSHMLGQSHGRSVHPKKYELEDILVENSTYNRCHLKRRLLEEDILDNKCSECGMEPLWMGKELVMILDHKNGVKNDNRKHNLRMLCPNCNSQQPTFSRGSKGLK